MIFRNTKGSSNPRSVNTINFGILKSLNGLKLNKIEVLVHVKLASKKALKIDIIKNGENREEQNLK